jgi:pre-rRNA-processing protein TSR3
MSPFLPTIIFRHRKENIKKCSLEPLKGRPDALFFTYPKQKLPDLTNYFVLSFDGPLLSKKDGHLGLLLVDATWNYAATMSQMLPPNLPRRSLPTHIQTAYPRKQTGCSEPLRGLASIEALYLAYWLLGRPTEGLLDHYYWKNEFLSINNLTTSE